MKTTRNLLNVVMDGITDANMLLDYAEDAAEENEPEVAVIFRNHAKKRIEALESLDDYTQDHIGLEAKIDAGDEIAAALKTHVESQIKSLEARIAAM